MWERHLPTPALPQGADVCINQWTAANPRQTRPSPCHICSSHVLPSPICPPVCVQVELPAGSPPPAALRGGGAGPGVALHDGCFAWVRSQQLTPLLDVYTLGRVISLGSTSFPGMSAGPTQGAAAEESIVFMCDSRQRHVVLTSELFLYACSPVGLPLQDEHPVSPPVLLVAGRRASHWLP
jgi:hypothetical protein